MYRHYLTFFFNDTTTSEIYTLSLHDALPISLNASAKPRDSGVAKRFRSTTSTRDRSEEHTSELQSLRHLVCRLLLEKKNHYNVRLCIRKQHRVERSARKKVGEPVTGVGTRTR